MDWTTIETLPRDVARYFEIEREDDKISSLVVKIPECKPLRIVGHDYSKAVRLQGPRPPKDIEIYSVDGPAGTLWFQSEKTASSFADAMSGSVKPLTVSEADLAKYPIADPDVRPSDDSDEYGLPF